MSLNFNVTTQRYMSDESKLHTRRRENLTSHMIFVIWCLHLPTSTILRPKYSLSTCLQTLYLRENFSVLEKNMKL
jgi:hypothetical protein